MKDPNWRSKPRGPQAPRFKEIPVIDGNGDEIAVYARETVERIPILGFPRKFVGYSIDTGETVKQIDDDTFLLIETGEVLRRVNNNKLTSSLYPED